MAKVLVVDDEMGIRELLSEILDDEGHEVLLAENAAAARAVYGAQSVDLVLLDIWMPDTDGMSLLREWSGAQALRCPVVMMSGHASIDTAVEAQTLGAVGFLEKPIAMHKLLAAVHKALYRAAAPTQLSTTVNTDSIQQADIRDDVGAGIQHSIEHNIEHYIQTSSSNSAEIFATDSHNAPRLSPWHTALSQVTLDTGLREFREEVERIYFTYIIEREQWAMTKVAEQAGLERTHLYRKLKQLNIEINRKSKS